MSRPTTPGFNLRRPGIQTTTLTSTSSLGGGRSTPSLGKQTISLEDWERLAPLTDEQVQSIAMIKEKYGERPYPEKVSSRAMGRPKTCLRCITSLCRVDRLVADRTSSALLLRLRTLPPVHLPGQPLRPDPDRMPNAYPTSSTPPPPRASGPLPALPRSRLPLPRTSCRKIPSTHSS